MVLLSIVRRARREKSTFLVCSTICYMLPIIANRLVARPVPSHNRRLFFHISRREEAAALKKLNHCPYT